MSATTLPPPQPPTCLTRSYVSRGIKGGTIIAEDVVEFGDHEARLRDPDRYRPDACRNCGFERVHAHCFRERRLRRADPEEPPLVVTVRIFRCARESCGAVFTVLPAFIARHLWRAWETIEEVARGKPSAPKMTRQRWFARLASNASQLVHIFAANVTDALANTITRSRPATRSSFLATIKPFVAGTASAFALSALWIHRLEAGVRLM